MLEYHSSIYQLGPRSKMGKLAVSHGELLASGSEHGIVGLQGASSVTNEMGVVLAKTPIAPCSWPFWTVIWFCQYCTLGTGIWDSWFLARPRLKRWLHARVASSLLSVHYIPRYWLCLYRLPAWMDRKRLCHNTDWWLLCTPLHRDGWIKPAAWDSRCRRGGQCIRCYGDLIQQYSN